MNKKDMFEKLFDNKGFVVDFEGIRLSKRSNSVNTTYYNDETDEPMITIGKDYVLCTECDCEFRLNNCEAINDHTLQLVCPECMYKYKVVFVNSNTIPLGEEVKSLMDGSTYIVKVGNDTLHALYTEGQFLCIEKNDEPIKPDLVEREVFLTNSQVSELRG